MRYVYRKESTAPTALEGYEVRKAKDSLSQHYRLPDTERLRRRPPLHAQIWTDLSVSHALHLVFRSKCAYCESPILHKEPGEISHHRPTSSAVGFTNHEEKEPSPEHYSWLAYDWQNLFLTCVACNRAKRNIFPVQGPRARIRSTWREAEIDEQALLINPCRILPKNHLTFSMKGFAVGKTEIGDVTINVLKLNRDELVNARSDKFLRCIDLLENVRHDQSMSEKFQLELSDDAPFSGCAQIALYDFLKKFTKVVGLPKPNFRNLHSDAIRIALVLSTSQWNLFLNFSDETPNDQDVTYASEGLRLEKSRLMKAEAATSQLQRISIHNFKGIRHLELEVMPTHKSNLGAPCLMLLGENSTGKSSTLQAIALALMSEKQRSRVKANPEDFIPREDAGWQLNESNEPTVFLEFDTGEQITLGISTISKKFIGQASSRFMVFAYGSRRFFDEDINKPQPESHLSSLFQPFARIQHPGIWLQGLSDNQFDTVARAIRPVLVLREDDHIGRDSAGRLFVHAHGRQTPLERLSDGYRSLLAMILDVMRGMLEEWGDLSSARGIVLIDEIETHLHPRWKLRVVSALREAMPNVQFIATTHDPLCLRGMLDGEVQVLERREDHSIGTLKGLPDVRGLRAEQLLTSEYFGLSSTSDPDLESALNRIALPASQQDSRDEETREIIRSLKWIGNTPADQIANEALRRFVQEAKQELKIDYSVIREKAVNEVLEKLRQTNAGSSL